MQQPGTMIYCQGENSWKLIKKLTINKVGIDECLKWKMSNCKKIHLSLYWKHWSIILFSLFNLISEIQRNPLCLTSNFLDYIQYGLQCQKTYMSHNLPVWKMVPLCHPKFGIQTNNFQGKEDETLFISSIWQRLWEQNLDFSAVALYQDFQVHVSEF